MSVQTLDVISVNIWNILISIANLVILYLLVKRFLFKPVQKMLSDRQKAVDKVYDEANAARQEAIDDKILYSEKLANAKTEANDIIRTANERANAISEDIISDARSKANAALRKADEDIAFERKKAINEIKNDISDISVDIAEKMIGREINKDDHRELIDSFIDSVGEE